MKILCIAIGNSLRGDDGVAHRIAERLERSAGVEVRSVLQLAPEDASEVAHAEVVVFIDADVDATEPSIEPVITAGLRGTPLLHSLRPCEVVWFAERLFGFAGRAYLCRVPVEAFEGEGLTAVAEAGAAGAVVLLHGLVTASLELCR